MNRPNDPRGPPPPHSRPPPLPRGGGPMHGRGPPMGSRGPPHMMARGGGPPGRLPPPPRGERMGGPMIMMRGGGNMPGGRGPMDGGGRFPMMMGGRGGRPPMGRGPPMAPPSAGRPIPPPPRPGRPPHMLRPPLRPPLPPGRGPPNRPPLGGPASFGRNLPPPPLPRPVPPPPPPPPRQAQFSVAPHGMGMSVKPWTGGQALPNAPLAQPAHASRPYAPQSATAMSSPASTSAALTTQPAAQSPSTTLATSTNPEMAWTTHSAPNGMKYYYNSVTKESTYNKPEALKRIDGDESMRESKSRTKWVEYTDQTSGKTYYSDGVTTTWEKPTEFAEDDESAGVEPPRKKKKSAKKESPYNSKEEAIAAFKGLLLAKDIAPTLKWNELTKLCSSDSRWIDCEDALTTGARRQALAEYQTKRANELRSIERQERARAKEVFGQLLSSVLPSLRGFSAWDSRFADVRDDLAKDDRFHVVADEETRESLFLDFCEEYRKREERKKRNVKRGAQEAFLAFLREKQESGLLSYASTWESFLSAMDESERKDNRFAPSPDRSDEDRQLYFADFVIELQATEDDRRRRIRDSRQRAEQEQRDAFRASLSKLAVNGKLLPASRWRNMEEMVSLEPSVSLIQAQGKEKPRELFENFANEWNASYRRDRTFLSQLVYPSSKADALVKPDTTFEEFTKALLERASESPDMQSTTREIIYRSDPVSSALLYFNELSMRARGIAGPAVVRRGSALMGKDSDSSEDEGEIIEDGEFSEM